MAVKKCCVENCKSCSTRKEDKGVTFHKFPKDATSSNEWQYVTRYRHTLKDLTTNYVCSRHFCKGDFHKNKDSKYILKSDAIPSIFPWTIYDMVRMDASQIEESLSSTINKDETDMAFCIKESEVENLEAIKKFIEEQEKEIHYKELQDKELLQKKPENVEIVKEPDKNREISKEENMEVASSVMDMILSESEAQITEKVTEENSTDSPIKTTFGGNENCNQKIMSSNDKGNASMSLSIGSKVEVKDFGGDWYAAEIAEVDYDEMEVLVRYEIDLKKHDEWISVSSPRLRPFTGTATKPSAPAVKDESDMQIEKAPPLKDKTLAAKEKEKRAPEEEPKEDIVKLEEKPKLVFEVGERCLARWRDNRRFVATIHKDLGNGKFEIIFDDGFNWTCTLSRLHKLKGDCLTIDTSFQSASVGSPSPRDIAGPSTSNAPISPSVPFHTHLFDPSRDYLGSKSERREKKRKINIKEIFNIGQKRPKMEKSVKEKTPKTPVEKKPRGVRKNLAPTVLKKEIKTEIPDAVASIIGTVTNKCEIKIEPISDTFENRETSEITNGINDAPVKATASRTVDIKEELDDMAVDVEPVGCVVNPNDKTLDDEDMEESKSERDPVFEEEEEEEVELENFEKQDLDKHEEVIDKIKEAIFKLEGDISEIKKVNSPTVERIDSPVKDLLMPKKEETLELNQDVKPKDLKDVLAEVAASIEVNDSNAGGSESSNVEVVKVEPKVPKVKRDPSKVKKGKKLRSLQEKKVKRQVEKVRNELEVMKRQFEEMRKQMLEQTQEFVQSQDSSQSSESCLLPGEWCCRWVNGQPVGKVSEIEGAVQMGIDNRPVLPRRSVEVEDARLPPGWTKHMVRRSVGHSAGKWDVVLVSPDELGNKRFHTKSDMRNFLENYPDDSLKPYEHALTDFGVHLKIARRLGWIFNTPDGIAEAPETILPAGTKCNLSPLVKRKPLNPNKRQAIMKEKKRSLMMKNKKKRRPIKLKLQKELDTYNSQIISGESSCEIQEPMDTTFEPPLMPLDDGYVYVGSLKVQIIESLLRCPAERCFKNFRTKTLLQMHIKHYHRELKAKMGATPKVLDLAYARTMPNEADLAQIDKKIIKVKINKPPRREEQKIPLSDSETSMDGMPTAPFKTEEAIPVLPRIPRSQDSPKLRQALVHKPVKRPKVLLPVRRLEPEQAVADSMNDDDFENPLAEPVVNIPMLQHPLDFETAISTHTVTKPFEKKKKGDKKKSFASFSKNISEDEEWFAMNSNDDDVDTRSSFPRSGSPDSKMDIKMAPMSSESNDDQKDAYTFTETGERVKIVHMKREEIINCHCGFREEDGLMVQCELCLCWQHALCHNIQRESEVPEKYTCSICLNPRRGRRSRRFLHDQDRLYEGLLPGALPSSALRRQHELTGNLLRIDDALHALRVKYYVASKKDHPKLYLWAKDWEQEEATYTQDKLNSDYSDLNIMINGTDKENHPVKQEDDSMDIQTPPPSEDQDLDRLSQRDNQLGSQALLSGLMSSPGGASLDLPISTSELERLAKSVQESAEWQRSPAAPQPEAAIDNDVCRERLLKHIQRCQALIDTRLDSIEAQVAELESQDPSFGEHYETAEFYPRTKQTVQMLLRDLDTMEELGVIT